MSHSPMSITFRANISSWVSAGHWQYLSWYIALSISTISGAFVCVHASCCKRIPTFRGDRYLGILNVLPLLTSLVTDVFVGGPEPWTAGTVKFDRPHTSFFQSCIILDSQSVDPQYPLLYQRCVLSDGTWLGAAVACVLWIMLACLTMWIKNPSMIKSNSVAVAPAKEPKWGRYIPEPPPSLRSSSLPIVPLPPRHGSIISHQNPYYQPRSDVSFDSQTSSSDYYCGGTGSKRYSSNYYDSPYSPTTPDYSSPYHYSNHYTSSYSTPTSPYYNSSNNNNNFPQLSMLPMVPRMDKIDLFDNSTPSINYNTTTDTNTKTLSNRFSGLFSSSTPYTPTSPTTQLPLMQPLSPPSHFAPSSLYQPQQQDKRISWGFSDYHYNDPTTPTSNIPPPPLSSSLMSPISPLSPVTPGTPTPLSASMLGPHYSSNQQRPVSTQYHRHSVASESSFGYSSSSNNNPPSTTVASSKDYYPVGSVHNNNSRSSPPPLAPELDDVERRRPSVITVDSVSVQKPQQYDMHRSSS
ncbi:hypothetical protein BDA99DRAFT_607320 [Phascolomyces articulosus]|uniref:Uncharacterized protein n=1 Tax=Phascolomyces articulosus TaxID=60185 RepID=A0AAD5JUS7_9FUNG|nr:hypothetical protein BDA99DRAFT_607320 [Phascolomyces articulosus]